MLFVKVFFHFYKLIKDITTSCYLFQLFFKNNSQINLILVINKILFIYNIEIRIIYNIESQNIILQNNNYF